MTFILALKRWMLTVDRLQQKFHISVTPVFSYIDDEIANDEVVIDSNKEVSSVVNEYKIKLRPQWAMVAHHPKFQPEYKDHIRFYLWTFFSLILFIHI